MRDFVLHRVYLAGYSRKTMPCWFRRTFARSEIHRAWLLGFDGCFIEGSVKYGPANPYSAADPANVEGAEWTY